MTKLPAKQYKFIPYLFFIFFLVIFTVDFTYIYIAKKSWRGVYSENAYQKGLQYNQVLIQKEKQKQLGWLVKPEFKQISAQEVLVEVRLTDKHGSNIKGAKIKSKIIRPIQEGFDFLKDFTEINHLYQAKIKFPFTGQWEIQFMIEKDGNKVEHNTRYVVL